MMPVNHAQSHVCHVTCASNRMLTAVDLIATGVIVNKYFLNITYNPLKQYYENKITILQEILLKFSDGLQSRNNHFFIRKQKEVFCNSPFSKSTELQVTSKMYLKTCFLLIYWYCANLLIIYNLQKTFHAVVERKTDIGWHHTCRPKLRPIRSVWRNTLTPTPTHII